MEGVDLQNPACAPTRLVSGYQSHICAGALERGQGARDKTLGPAVRVVALPDHRQFHFASSSRAAACTASTERNTRHSLTLPPPQPSCPHGRQECEVRITRCSTFHGPHSNSPLGPNSATVRVPMAEARCIGIESTPMKSFARAASAPSSLMLSLPARLTTF